MFIGFLKWFEPVMKKAENNKMLKWQDYVYKHVLTKSTTADQCKMVQLKLIVQFKQFGWFKNKHRFKQGSDGSNMSIDLYGVQLVETDQFKTCSASWNG